MSDLLSIGSSGVAAYQRALTTVSNNISNVGTEGYVRQETALSENMPRNQGRVYLGTGVNVAGINRAYDQFLEQNLRNSTSELNTQGPMVNYANRVVDIMGSDTVGLNNSLDKFFATARSLSVDPSSIVLRQQFLRDADGLAAGFRELSNQMTTVDTETRDAINARVADINTLAGQIATVNKQMAKHPLVSRQPPDLLDQRDLLLTKLSKLVKINVTTAQNGAVDISMGTLASAGKIVVGDRSTPLMANFNEQDLSRVAIILDPYAKFPEEVVGVSSGELGGLMGFREQVLQPSFEALDNLAVMVTGELNQIHANGIDLDGEVGKPLFTIDKITRMDPRERTTIQIDRASAGIRLVIDDPKKIAAGGLFRVIENPNNLSGTDAVLNYEPSYADPSRVRSLSQVLKNNPNPSAGISAPADQLLGQIPLGASNWSLFMDNATDKQNIQVLTRDGRHLLGAPITDEAARRALLTTNNGFIKGTTYSDTYLNETDETGYKQMSMFYGLKSLTGSQYDQATQFSLEHMVVPSTIERKVLVGETIPADLKLIEADRLTINGHSLPALYPTAPAQTIQASDIAEWMNRAVENDDPPVAVNATTTTPDLTTIDPTQGLYINGAAIPPEAGRTLAGLILQINSQYASDANVFASLNDAGNALVLRNAEGYGGNDIHIGGMDADGNITTQTSYRGKLNFGQLSDITIGYGKQGRAGDLAPLGQPLGEYFTGLMPIIPTAARIGSARIPAGVDSIAANTLTLNGVTLGGIDYNRPLKAPDLAAWLNATGSSFEPPVVVRGVNQIKANAALIKEGLQEDRPLLVNGVSISGNGPAGTFTSTQEIAAAINGADTGRVVASLTTQNLSRNLSINGTTIIGSGVNGVFSNRADLVTKINLASGATGVTATLNAANEVTLSNANGEDIIIGPLDEGNALGVASGTYSKVYAEMDKFGNLLISNGSGADISISTLSGGANALGVGNGTYRGTLEMGSDAEIRFGFTDTNVESGPAELAKLGLRTGIYIDGAVQEDLLVFVSAGSGTVTGSYDATMADPVTLNAMRIDALRAEKYDVTFTSENQYQITWRNPSTGVKTILAEREYDPKQGIEYRGVHLMLNRPPVTGDTFLIDGNQDGTGNNQNMLDIVALQTKGVVGGNGGRTISQAYEEQLGRVGNFASQAKIAQDALKVVNDQAIESRDKVSGVSLDSEAADLIRFQQAYQASAKAMQVSGDLFDAILQAAR